MNDKARLLGMSKTRYANSHGLANPNNRSTAYDIALLSHYAMQNALFRDIVATRTYEATIKFQAPTSKQDIQRYSPENNNEGSDHDDPEEDFD